MPLKEVFLSLTLPEKKWVTHHTGPRGEAPNFVRQKERKKAWLTVFIVFPSIKVRLEKHFRID